MSSARPAVLIVGNLDNRRVTGFVAALARMGWPAPTLLAHEQLLGDGCAALAELPDRPTWVRIESLGEHPGVDQRLLERGAAALPDDARCSRVSVEQLRRSPRRHGQLLAPAQHHAGLLGYFAELDAVFASKRQWRVLNPIADLQLLFDKPTSSRRYASAGIPVPEQLPGLDALSSADQLREAMVAARWPTVFVKLASGSSASGVAMYRHLPNRPPGDRDLLLTTVAGTPAAWFNSLRLQRLDQRERLDAVLDWLLAERVQIERAIPKPRLDGRTFDLRVVVIAGDPAFCVVRQSPHPITNLHLGGTRGDLEALRRRVDPEVWSAAMASCARVHAEHRCLHLGVDLLFTADLREHRVIEANAFGDLLPGLTRAGLTVYEHELAALDDRRFG